MAAALSAALGASQAAAVDEREAQERLDAIGERIQAATQDLSATRDARDNANEDLREVETALAETHARLDALQAEKRDLSDEIAALENRRQALEDERQAQLAAIEEQLDALAAEHLAAPADMILVVVGDKETILPSLEEMDYTIVELDADGNPVE